MSGTGIGSGYGVARSMRRAVAAALFVVGLLVASSLTSCAWGQLRSEDVLPLAERVVVRHDAYVGADANLPDDQRAEALDQSAGVLAVLYNQVVPNWVAFAPTITVVADRHNRYVVADVTLHPDVARMFLNSANIVLAMVEDQLARSAPR